MPLTPEQKLPVEYPDNCIIYAVPGTGKTTTLVAKAAHLIQHEGVHPQKLLVLTFTRAAANELLARLSSALGDPSLVPTVGTFHEIGARSLDNPRFADTEERMAAFDLALTATGHKMSLSAFDKLCEQLTVSGCANAPQQVARIFVAYKNMLRCKHLCDFPDALEAFSTRLESSCDWTHALIDECQDNNEAQWSLINKLASNGVRVTLVGDPNQSIYEWRGARNMEERISSILPDAQIFSIQTTHRFGVNIAREANDVLSKLASGQPCRHIKLCEKPPSDSVFHLTSKDTAKCAVDTVKLAMSDMLFSPSEISVLVRYNRDANTIARLLERDGVPVKVVFKPSLCAFMHKVAIASLDPISLPDCFEINTGFAEQIGMCGHPSKWRYAELFANLLQWYNQPRLQSSNVCHLLSPATKEAVAELHMWNSLAHQDLSHAVIAMSSPDNVLTHNEDEVSVTTIHQAKGREWPCVIACIPPDAAKPDAKKEELRLLFVQMTRAKETLYLIHHEKERN